MLTGWIKIDEMAANNTSPPTSIQLCGKTLNANRRGSAAATPAHGTAFDIAGKGIANLNATRKAFDILCRMGANFRRNRLAA